MQNGVGSERKGERNRRKNVERWSIREGRKKRGEREKRKKKESLSKSGGAWSLLF